MDILILFVLGGVIGWVASLLMRTDEEQGLLLNIAGGIAGSAVGGLFVTPLLGAVPIAEAPISFGSIVVSLLGAVILLAAVNLLRPGAAR